MLYYRLYFMDRYSGHIDHFREFEAADEALRSRSPNNGATAADGIVESPPQAEALGRSRFHPNDPVSALTPTC